MDENTLQELLRRFPTQETTNLDKIATKVEGAGAYLRKHLFDKQLAFATDPAKQKAALCTRRAGKTEVIAQMLLETAVENSQSICLYYAPTKRQAKNIIWPKLKRLVKHYSLQVEFKETESSLHFENGSIVYIYGADKVSDIDAALGLAVHMVVLDEAGSFGPHLELLVNEVLGPTTFDYGGQMVMIGTPTRNHTGFFYEVTNGKRDGWSLHKWSVFDNSQMPRWAGKENWQDIVREELEDELRRTGQREDDPVVQRQWFGRWIKEENSMLYSYTEDNILPALPPNHNWRGILGIDIGKNTAYQVVLYATDLNLAVLVHGEKTQGDLADDIADKIKDLKDRWPQIYKTVMDTGGLGDMIAEEIRRRHGIPVLSAKKSGKLAFINVLNSMLKRKRLVMTPGNPVAHEWDTLQKDEFGEEIKGQDNHLSDATLYAVREAQAYLSIEQEPDTRSPQEREFDEWEDAVLRASAKEQDTSIEAQLEGLWTPYN